MRYGSQLLQMVPFKHLKVVRFIVSGGTSALLNFALLWGFTELLHIWYLVSAIIAFIISSSFTFVLQKFWTFENHSLDRVHVEVPQFVILALVNLAFNSALLFALVEYVHVWYLLGQAICIAGIAVMNFCVYHFYIFAPKDTTS